MALQADDIADLVTTTQRDLGKMKWTDIASDIQEHHALPQLLKTEKVTFQSGYGIQWNLMVQTSGAAEHTGLFAVDNVNVGDVMKTANIPWRHTTTKYAFERREVAMNRRPARIVELVKTRRADAMIDLADTLEDCFWNKPVDSTDETTPYGIYYWAVKNATTGFNGGNPSGFTSGAGNLSSSTYTRHANYTAQYASITKSDLVKKMRTAYRKIGFKSPIDIPSYARGKDRYVIYTNETGISGLEDLGENQNENLGRDIASMDGRIVFRGNPVRWVPQLDNDSEDPFFFINWAVLAPVCLEGEYMNESGPMLAANQHTTYRVFTDLTWNLQCTNRRRLACIATGASNTEI